MAQMLLQSDIQKGARLLSEKVPEEIFRKLLAALFADNFKDSISTAKTYIDSAGITETLESIFLAEVIVYIVHRLRKVLISPSKLQEELSGLGFSTSKIETLVTNYSLFNINSIKSVVEELKPKESGDSDKSSVQCGVFNEVKSLLFKSRRKTTVTKISLRTEDNVLDFKDLDQAALTNLFDIIESIQIDLDGNSLF